jgi:hypothetical protein
LDDLSDRTVDQIDDLFSHAHILTLKSDLLQLYEHFDLRTDEFDRNMKDGPFMLIIWLNNFIDSVYKDVLCK